MTPVAYHASPVENRASILAHGLSLEHGKRRWWHNPPGVYFYFTPDEPDESRCLVLDVLDVPFDVWEVDVRGLPLFVDPETEDLWVGSYYTPGPVPPSAVRLATLTESF